MAASYTYLDAESPRTTPILSPALARRACAQRRCPRHMAGLFVDYTVRTGPLSGLGLGTGVRYVGSSYNAANTVKIGGYTLVDAVVRYDLGRFGQI